MCVNMKTYQDDRPGTVYLLHFDRPISNRHTCQHYVGWAADLDTRLKKHRAGNGARLTEVATERGIGFTLVRTWQGTRRDERRLKNQKSGPAFCPVCANGQRPKGAGWMEEIDVNDYV